MISNFFSNTPRSDAGTSDTLREAIDKRLDDLPNLSQFDTLSDWQQDMQEASFAKAMVPTIDWATQHEGLQQAVLLLYQRSACLLGPKKRAAQRDAPPFWAVGVPAT